MLEFPTIEVRPPDDFGPLDARYPRPRLLRLARLHQRQRRRGVRRDASTTTGWTCGPCRGTRGSRPSVRRRRERVERPACGSTWCPREFRAEALIEDLPAGRSLGSGSLSRGRRVAREVLPEKLREAGAEVVVPPAYESVPSSEGAERVWPGGSRTAGWTASPSPPARRWRTSSGRSARRRRGGLLAGTRVACIGPITADTARGHGIRVDAEAREYTIPGLVEAVVDLFVGQTRHREVSRDAISDPEAQEDPPHGRPARSGARDAGSRRATSSTRSS